MVSFLLILNISTQLVGNYFSAFVVTLSIYLCAGICFKVCSRLHLQFCFILKGYLEAEMEKKLTEKYKIGIWNAVPDLVPFVRFKKREKHKWRCFTFTWSNSPPWVIFTFLHLQVIQKTLQLTFFVIAIAINSFSLSCQSFWTDCQKFF